MRDEVGFGTPEPSASFSCDSDVCVACLVIAGVSTRAGFLRALFARSGQNCQGFEIGQMSDEVRVAQFLLLLCHSAYAQEGD